LTARPQRAEKLSVFSESRFGQIIFRRMLRQTKLFWTVFPKKCAEFSRRFVKIIREPAPIEAELSTTGNTQLNSRSIRNTAALGVSPSCILLSKPYPE
jgi:hypothetical protein